MSKVIFQRQPCIRGHIRSPVWAHAAAVDAPRGYSVASYSNSAPPLHQGHAAPVDISGLLADLESVKAEEEAVRKRKEQIELQIKAFENGGPTAASPQPTPEPIPNFAPRLKYRKRSVRMQALAAAVAASTAEAEAAAQASSPPSSFAAASTSTMSSPPPSTSVPALPSPSHPALTMSSVELGDNMWLAPWTPSPPLENDPCDVRLEPRPIFVISDCTGESAARTVRAALGQFQEYLKKSCPANLLVFRFLGDEKKAYKIIERAKEEDALVVFSLVDPGMVKAVKTAAKLYGVNAVDLWSQLLDSMEQHLHALRSGVPLGDPKRKAVLSEDYFKMIEAVEYTRKMDDGAQPEAWHQADLLILGVSRSGKTPLCIYLGQRGYKVANLPLVPNLKIPKELYEIDQSRIVGLSIDPTLLASIRKNRVGQLGDVGAMDYAEVKQVREELEFARSLYRANPEWPVLDVTFRGVEETAARILRVMSERRGHLQPMWAEEYNKSHQKA